MKKNSLPSAETKPGPSQAALAWAVETGQSEKLARHVEAAVQRARRHRVVGASTAAIVLLAGGLFWRLPDRTDFRPVSTIVLRPAQQTLPDGSVVELMDNTTITEQFRGNVRRVILQSGEAHFAVVKDSTRPFVVVAGGIEVRAVGTSFAVGVNAQTVDVVVTEGRVAVEQSATLASSSASLLTHVNAGSRTVVNQGTAAAASGPQVVSLTSTQLQQRLAWRVPRLEFSSTPLSEVIPMFNHNAGVQMVLDPALGTLQMSGVLRADNVDALLRLLKDEFGIEAEQRDTNIFLRRR